MRKGSTLTTEQKQKVSAGVRRTITEKGGFSEQHRQRLSDGQKRRYALIARLFAYARETQGVNTGTLQHDLLL
jgi:hypothetical protein